MFVLDNPKAKEPTYIFFQMYINGRRCRKSTGEKVQPVEWRNERTPHPHINVILDKIRMAVEKADIDARYTGRQLSPDLVGDFITEATGKTMAPRRVDFKTGSELIIQEMKDGKLLTKQKKKFSPGTIKNYEQSLAILLRFGIKEYDNITMDTYRLFIVFCNEKLKVSLNYVGQNVKIWICLLKEARRRKWHNNDVHTDEGFKKPTENTIDIHLEDSEIDALYNFEIDTKKNPRWAKVRDWFIIDCYTGLRISDLKRLSKINLNKSTLMIANEKTDATVIIPLHPRVKEILRRRKGFPPSCADQEINRVIKKICEKVGFDEQIIYSYTKAGKRVDIPYKKWEMVSNHTARRSFITNLLAAGVPNSIVKKLTGIVKDATVERYNKITEAQAAKIAAAHPYFT